MNKAVEVRERRWRHLRLAGWTSGALLLLLPLVAGAPWTAGDFIFAGLVIGITGLTIELAARSSRSHFFAAAVAVAVATSVLTILAAGAVGMIGDEDNRHNLLFYGVVALALAGAAVARFRPMGMAFVMGAAAIAQLAVSIGGLAVDLKGGIYSMAFAGAWLLSAALFRKAAREEVRNAHA